MFQMGYVHVAIRRHCTVVMQIIVWKAERMHTTYTDLKMLIGYDKNSHASQNGSTAEWNKDADRLMGKCCTYPSATSRSIINAKPNAVPMVPMLV